MELKLPSIYKAFYLLYLNHPEGINYQIVNECRDELVQWYRWSNPRNTDVSKIDKCTRRSMFSQFERQNSVS